jgi:amino-acid N-acetyltransferase
MTPTHISPRKQGFILSIIRANPTLRDAKSYFDSFPVRPVPQGKSISPPAFLDLPPRNVKKKSTIHDHHAEISARPHPVAASILNTIDKRTALVKMQGPLTDKQLSSVCRGMVYLEKLGLVSVVVVENDELARGDEGERAAMIEQTMRVVSMLEKEGAKSRPVLGTVVRLGPRPGDDEESAGRRDFKPPEAHTIPSDLVALRSALRAGEIPVLAPFALDSFCRSVRVDANDILAALARGMVEAAQLESARKRVMSEDEALAEPENFDLTPLRLMIINREGGVPSYARYGYPHLLINMESEHSHIHNTFHPPWRHSHPTALSNLDLARTCLAYMPPTSSAVMVSHRSPSSLIANLITNKPAVSSSLPHALLQSNRRLTPHTPTLLRRGLPIRVVNSVDEIDKAKLKTLLEHSFGRTLDEEPFYQRLERDLDFAVIAGDYAGAAIVTNEPCPDSTSGPISYLDKFAVLPSHQGDGTVDFLWVALHDESYGLGHPFSVNPNGGKEGEGEGRDLVWRSRSNNPVNKWYFERSSGHTRMGPWVLFWCDAEKHLKIQEARRAGSKLSFVGGWEEGRLASWAKVVPTIPSSWK